MKKLLILLGVFLVIGQFSEIKEQTLNYGDYIQQLAVIHFIGESVDYWEYCKNCTAYITVKDPTNHDVIINKNMTALDGSLFGYLANPSDFNLNTRYRAIINTSSPSYGSDIVSSYFTISGDSTAEPVTISSDAGGFGSLTEGLGNILLWVWDRTFKVVFDTWTNAFNADILGIKSLFTVLSNFFNLIVEPFIPILKIFIWFFNGILKIIRYILDNPLEYVFFALISNIIAIIAVFVIPFAFIQFAIILYVFIKNEEGELNLFNFVGGIFKGNYVLLTWVANIIIGLIRGVKIF